jgi:hypothetical protein
VSSETPDPQTLALEFVAAVRPALQAVVREELAALGGHLLAEYGASARPT